MTVRPIHGHVTEWIKKTRVRIRYVLDIDDSVTNGVGMEPERGPGLEGRRYRNI